MSRSAQSAGSISIRCECFCKRKEEMLPRDSYAIAQIMARLGEWSKPEKLAYLPIYGRQRIYKRL